jgi:two-component system sensor histidine kinase DegS
MPRGRASLRRESRTLVNAGFSLGRPAVQEDANWDVERYGVENRSFQTLKWVTTVVPAIAVVAFEVLRHNLLDRFLSLPAGNVLVGFLALNASWIFSRLIFRKVDRLHAQALVRSREMATLSAMMHERETLSRELHDGLAQLAASLLVRLDTVGELVKHGASDDALREIEQLRGMTSDLYGDVRESIVGLRARIDEVGLVHALRSYLDSYEDRHGIIVTFESEEAPATIPPIVGIQLFRIMQEALTNVRKHAGARSVVVRLDEAGPGTLILSIADDGKGFDVAAAGRSGGFGLTMMRERAQGLGGSFSLQSDLGSGTTITVRLPLSEMGEESREAVARSLS